MDSGAAGIFMSQDLLSATHVTTTPLASAITVRSIDGKPVGDRSITQVAVPVHLTINSTRSEFIQFLVWPL